MPGRGVLAVLGELEALAWRAARSVLGVLAWLAALSVPQVLELASLQHTAQIDFCMHA